MGWYVAGPMTGVRDFNRTRFDAAERALSIAYPHAVIFNPHRKDRETIGEAAMVSADGRTPLGFDLRATLRMDAEWIFRNATHMAMLPRWNQSKGAFMEHSIATALGLSIIYLSEDKLCG